jgi:hypothetical protein
MSEASPATDGALLRTSSGQGEATVVERRRVQRRRGSGELRADISRDFDDRRLGLGRRLDDWRRKPEGAATSDAVSSEASETPA